MIRKVFSLFIDNMHEDLSIIDFKNLFSSFGDVLDAYIPNSNKLETHESANEAMDADVHEGLSDNSKTITQPFNNAHGRPIYVGKFTSQVPSCGSCMGW